MVRLARSERSLEAEARFDARLEALGATLLETRWLGVDSPHRVRCANGHVTNVRPNNLIYKEGAGICRACIRKDPGRAYEEFLDRLRSQGVTLLESGWLGSTTPHRVRCAEGHETATRPYYGQQYPRRVICRTCRGTPYPDAEANLAEARAIKVGHAMARFKALLATQDIELTELSWRGSLKSHEVTCAHGHVFRATPSKIREMPAGKLYCPTCRMTRNEGTR